MSRPMGAVEEMEMNSQGIQCCLSTCDRVEKYLDVFAKNNLSENTNTVENINRSLLLKHVALIEEFEQEKKEMLEIFDKEKRSLKKAFENERKEYEMELEKLRHGTVIVLDELEKKYQKEVENRDALLHANFEKERDGLRVSVQEQMNLIADVEKEIKRILARLLVELKQSNMPSCEKLKTDLCGKDFKIDKACLMWLKEAFNENIGPNKSCVYTERANASCQQVKNEENSIPLEKDELHEVGEVFRKQKKELTEIFMQEKKHLENQIKEECLEHKKKLDKEYEERAQAETQEWQETIKEYEREIAILRYERQQMDRNYCLEIDRLKLETELEKVEICTRYRKEHEKLRRKLSDKVSDVMFRENGPIKRGSVHVSDQEVTGTSKPKS